MNTSVFDIARGRNFLPNLCSDRVVIFSFHIQKYDTLCKRHSTRPIAERDDSLLKLE